MSSSNRIGSKRITLSVPTLHFCFVPSSNGDLTKKEESEVAVKSAKYSQERLKVQGSVIIFCRWLLLDSRPTTAHCRRRRSPEDGQ